MHKLHTVQSTERLLSDAIASCPPSAGLYASLRALRAPLSHLNQLTNLDVDAWQTTLNELGNFADDVAALLSRCRSNDPESEQRLNELHVSAVNHELDLDARGFLTAFHPSHSHAAHIRDLAACVNAPPDCLKQVFHSLPTLLTCVHTVITIPLTSNSIENALKTALKATATGDSFPAPDTTVPPPDYSRYTLLRASVDKYIKKLEDIEKHNPHSRRVVEFLRILMEPGVLQYKRLKLYIPSKPFHLPAEVGRSLQTTVYKANTSVYDGDKHLWITKIALKAYPVNQTMEALYDNFHQETLRLRTLSHPCLPAFYGYHWPSFESQASNHGSDLDNRPSPRVLLATELMARNLFQARLQPALRHFKVRLRILRDVADALAYLHGEKLYHGRLNPSNVLLRMSRHTVYGRVKVDVTSLAGRVLLNKGLNQRPVSSLIYRAPETMKTGPKFFTSDVWSLGMLGCFLMVDRREFLNDMCDGVFTRMIEGSSLFDQVRAWCTSIPETKMRFLIERCLNPDPSKRWDSLSVMHALDGILKDHSILGGPSREKYFEEVVDGSVVDEVIDSSAVENPPFQTSILNERMSPLAESKQRHYSKISHPCPADSEGRDKSSFALAPDHDSEGYAIRKFSRLSTKLKQPQDHCDLQAMVPEIIDEDEDSDDTEDPAHQFVLAQNLEKGCGVDVDIPRAIELYRSAHRKGYSRATFRLAQCYQAATGVKKCLTTATHLFEQAAGRECPLAMIALGRLYETGKGVKESHSSSADWFRRAADCGSAEGLRCYAKCLLEGFGVREDTARAVALFTKAYERGDVEAGFELAVCLRDGVGTKKDVKRACELLRCTAERGHADSQLEFANCLYEGIGTSKNFGYAFDMYKRSADRGHMDACRHLGECYELGHGVEKDADKAVECFRKASDAGNASAMSSLAGSYERGEGVDHDMKKAIQLYKKAERKNDYLALNNLGVLFERGIHVKQDFEKAVKYYRKAKQQGFTEAACNLADCYLKGNGVPKDIYKAIDMYRKAAEEGHAGAKCELGNFYYRGLGIPRDYNLAVNLFQETCDAEPEALRLLGIAYLAGNGIQQDIHAAVKLFARAVGGGNSEANMNLGLCTMEGCGVAKCLPRAASLLASAAEGGSKEAKLILGNMYYEGRGVQRDLQRAVKLFSEGESVDLDML